MIFWFLLFSCQQKDDDGNPIVDIDEDGFLSDIDCDDNNPAIHPQAQEICNGLDDDCDSLIDDAAQAVPLPSSSSHFVTHGNAAGFPCSTFSTYLAPLLGKCAGSFAP